MPWVTTNQPTAELVAEPDGPVTRDDGTVITIFKTRFDKRYAKLVEPSGFILWLQETK